MAEVIYVLLYHITSYRRKVVQENLKNVFPDKNLAEINDIEKNFYHYLAALIVEIIKMTTISKKELQKRFQFKNAGLMEAFFKNGESVLVCSAHYGNWEWGTLATGLLFSAQNYPIYKPLNNQIFNSWFQKVRSKFGNKMVAMRQTLRALHESKNEPSIFCFGNDQAPSKDESHYWTNLLNQQSSIQLGIKKIAKKTNRPIFYFKERLLRSRLYTPLYKSPRHG